MVKYLVPESAKQAIDEIISVFAGFGRFLGQNS
jgi:hypothetical protein